MPADLQSICRDLAAEQADLDRILADLAPEDWDRPTPADGWLVRDEISHLISGDDRARLAAGDPAAFEAFRAERTANPDAYREQVLQSGRVAAPADLLTQWRDERERMLTVFRALPPDTRVPWFGPAMSAASFITARLMETWAHGQDIVDTVGATRLPTARLQHIAHIAVRARPYSYSVNGRELPAGDILVELTAPDGATWRWGNPAARDRVRGTAEDFCLVTTQRRHRADTDLIVAGPLAEEWIAIAQAYAGPAGTGRQPGQFPKTRSRTS